MIRVIVTSWLVALLALAQLPARSDQGNEFAALRNCAARIRMNLRLKGRKCDTRASWGSRGFWLPQVCDEFWSNMRRDRENGSKQHAIAAVERTSRKYGLNSNFIKAVITVESGWNCRARSPMGACGLMQLMPDTAEILGVKNSWDIRQNIEGGTKFLYLLLTEFRDPELALIGYHAGPLTVRQHRRIPKETRKYVRKVFQEFRNLEDREQPQRRTKK